MNKKLSSSPSPDNKHILSEAEGLEMWAVVELMGHGRTAGMIRTSDMGSLLRVDVPIEDGYRTEYYGESAIYSIKVVSEEIARAYALPDRNIVAYDEPIVPRQQYEEALKLARHTNSQLQYQIEEMRRRLTAVNALPEPREPSHSEMDYETDPEEDRDDLDWDLDEDR